MAWAWEMNLLLAEGSNDKSLEFPTTRGFHPEVGLASNRSISPFLRIPRSLMMPCWSLASLSLSVQ